MRNMCSKTLLTILYVLSAKLILSQTSNIRTRYDTVFFQRNSSDLSLESKNKLKEYSSYIIENMSEHKFYLMDYSCYEEKEKNSFISFQRFKTILDLFDREYKIDRTTFLMIDSDYTPLMGCGSKENRRYVIMKLKVN